MPLNPTAPGVYVTTGSSAPSPSLVERTGTWFVTGECQEGPTGVAIPLTSMQDYANYLGGRNSFTQLYDSLDEFFHDGGSFAYVSRVVGATPVNAAITLADHSAVNTLTVTTNGPGSWGNAVTVVVAAGSVANTYTLTITDPATGRVWVSPNLTSPADAVTWAVNSAGSSPWIFPFTIANLGSVTSPPNNNPATGTFTLTGGTDNIAGVTETQWTNALTAFSADLGPGQVSAPGHNTQAGWEALIAHASATGAGGELTNNRLALLDDTDSATASTITAQVVQAQAGSGDSSFAMFLAPWVVIPGIPSSSTSSIASNSRTVPPSSLVAALMAASDSAGNNAGTPAAGANGQSSYATGVTQTYVETDRGTLDQAGVSVIRQIRGVVQLYGYKTISTNPVWVQASNARERMSLVDLLNQASTSFVFGQIDGQGHLLSAFAGALSGVCQDQWQLGALYGPTAADAYQVSVSSSAANLAAGILAATVSVRFSPYAEFVEVTVVSYPITSTLPS